MSYTYLQEQGEESSAGCFSDIPQSVLLNLNLTAEKSYSNGNAMAFCQSSQFGTMLQPLTATRGEEKSMSSVEDSHAKTSQAQEMEPESQENEANSGEKWPESLAKYDPNTHSWRTHQCLLFEDSTECLETFPKWGLMRGGELFLLKTVELYTREEGFGFWPTPTRFDATHRGLRAKGKTGNHHTSSLEWMVMEKEGKHYGILNPMWTEWLMGWIMGQTDLLPLEMDKFQLWLQQHGEFLEENK